MTLDLRPFTGTTNWYRWSPTSWSKTSLTPIFHCPTSGFGRFPMETTMSSCCQVSIDMRTPWGSVQTKLSIAPGIVRYTTARHGGFHLDRKRQSQVKKLFPDFTSFAGGPWYEEDCDWALVVITFPECFKELDYLDACKMVRWLVANGYDKWQPILAYIQQANVPTLGDLLNDWTSVHSYRTLQSRLYQAAQRLRNLNHGDLADEWERLLDGMRWATMEKGSINSILFSACAELQKEGIHDGVRFPT